MVNVKDKATGKVYQVVLDNPQGLVVKDVNNVTFAKYKSDVVVTTATTLSSVGA